MTTTADLAAVLPTEMRSLNVYALRLTKSPDRADDLVQDTLVRAHRFWSRFDGTNVTAWLRTIMRNQFFNSVRDGRAEESKVVLYLVEPLPETTTPETECQKAEAQAEFRTALSTLRDDWATMIELCDVQGWTYKEIANMLDVPLGTVMSGIYRGRRKLESALRNARAR